MNKVRWGLLSTANINQALIPAIRASRRGELIAVASRSKEKAEAYAQGWEIPQAFGSYQEMLDSGTVDAMITARDETSMVLAEAFMYRHHPQTKIAEGWARSGKLGEITLVRGAFDFFLPPKRRQPDALDVRLVPEYGGGCLWDVGVYPLSFAQFILGGPPDWVCESQWVGETGVDEVFSGQMGFSIAQISCSFPRIVNPR